MLISEIKPFVRYARYMELSEKSKSSPVIPLDARLIYVQSGSNVIEADGKKYEMKQGSVLIINSGIQYHIFPPEKNARYIVLNFDYTFEKSNINVPVSPTIPKGFLQKKLLCHCQFSDSAELNRVFFLSGASFGEKRLASIVKEYSRRLLFNEIKTSALLCECLCAFLREGRSNFANHEKGSIDEIITYIHENYEKPLTNIMLGEIFSYHPNYISSAVKLATGLPIHKYLIHVRLLRAVEMLENSNLSVGEIAAICGFCDIGYFSAYFKKQFGTAPSGYRKNTAK